MTETPIPTSHQTPTSSPTAWATDDLVNPHQVQDKARRVEAMFAAIAPSYDLNNRLHSMGSDQAWRKKAVKLAAVKQGDVVLDVACGTGDLSLAFARKPVKRVVGIDFTYAMLQVANQKNHTAKSVVLPSYHTGDAMRLPIADQSVDVVSIAFGIRNVVNPELAMKEFYRVLKPGGRLIVLEFSLPTNWLLRSLYHIYFHRIMPHTATWISGDRSGAYKYLPKSVNTFIGRQQMQQIFEETQFKQVVQKPVTFGIAVIYRGVKE